MSNQRIPVDAKNKGLAFRVVAMVAGPAASRGAVSRLLTTLNAYDTDLASLALDLGLGTGTTPEAQAGTVRTLVAYFDELINSNNFVRSDTKTGKQVLDELMATLDQG